VDGGIFDQLTREVSGANSRRGAIKLMAGTALAAAIARISPVAAKKHGKGKGKNRKKKCRKLNQGCGGKKKCCTGLTCTGGTCQNPPPPPACTANNDCGNGQICVGGSCVQQPPQQPDCTVDTDCAADKICLNGSCVLPQPECTVNNDCGIDEICVDGSCVLIEVECQGDDDCDGNELCINGFCECPDIEDGRCIRRCDSQTDCPGPSQCQNLAPEPSPFIVDGVCVDQPFLLCSVDRCTTNNDCQSSEVCVMQDCDGPDPVGVCYPFSSF
jgi:hypothetical protein